MFMKTTGLIHKKVTRLLQSKKFLIKKIHPSSKNHKGKIKDLK